MKTNRETNAIGRVASVFAMLRSAYAAGAAVDAGSKPRAVDLDRLGIDPRAFSAIGRS